MKSGDGSKTEPCFRKDSRSEGRKLAGDSPLPRGERVGVRGRCRTPSEQIQDTETLCGRGDSERSEHNKGKRRVSPIEHRPIHTGRNF